MTENKLRAVLTVFKGQKVLEIRFDGILDKITNVKVIPNYDNRHKINEKEFMGAFFNLIDAMNHYVKQLMTKYLLIKMMGEL